MILACRSIEKGETAKKTIQNFCQTNTSIEVWKLDLSDYNSIIEFSKRVQESLPRLDGFSANAGVEMTSFELCQGFEMSIVVNIISTFMLAFGVMPKLRETCDRYGTDTNLSFIGSMIHIFALHSQLQVPSGESILKSLSKSETADMNNRYPLSKLIEHMCFNEFIKIVAKDNENSKYKVVANIVNPGWCQTELGRYKTKGMGERIMSPLMIRTAEQGGRTLVHGLMASRECSGQYLSECQVKPQSTFVRSRDGMSVQLKVWNEVRSQIEGNCPHLVISS